MSATRKGNYRRPRTTQERKANQEKNDILVRPKRKDLPTSYDDFYIKEEKSWKSKRKQQQIEK